MTASSRTPEQVLADWRERATHAKVLHDLRIARIIDEMADEFARANEDYMTWLSEDDAMLKADHRRPWFIERFAYWASIGCAEKRNGKRFYRALVVPQRANLSAAEEAGRRAARERAS